MSSTPRKKTELVKELTKAGIPASMEEDKEDLEAKWAAHSATKKKATKKSTTPAASSKAVAKARSPSPAAKARKGKYPKKSALVDELLDAGYKASMSMEMPELEVLYDQMMGKKVRKGRGRDSDKEDDEEEERPVQPAPSSRKKSKVVVVDDESPEPISKLTVAMRQKPAPVTPMRVVPKASHTFPSGLKVPKSAPRPSTLSSSSSMMSDIVGSRRRVATPVRRDEEEEEESYSSASSSPSSSSSSSDVEVIARPLQRRSPKASSPRGKEEPIKESSIGIGFILVFLAIVSLGFAVLLLRANYCPTLPPGALSPAGSEAPLTCKPCPEKAFCLDGSVKCRDGFVASRRFNMTDFTLETRCDKDPTISKSARSLADEAIRMLRVWRGRCECGELSPCILTRDELQSAFFDSNMTERQHLIWEEVEAALKRSSLVQLHYNGSSFSAIDGILSWRCILVSYGWIVALSLSVFGVLWWNRRGRLISKRGTDHLVEKVLKLLEDRATGYRAGDTVNYPTPYLLVDHAREECLASSRSLQRLWPGVLQRIESDSRIEKSQQFKGGELTSAWEMILS